MVIARTSEATPAVAAECVYEPGVRGASETHSGTEMDTEEVGSARDTLP